MTDTYSSDGYVLQVLYPLHGYVKQAPREMRTLQMGMSHKYCVLHMGMSSTLTELYPLDGYVKQGQ